MKIKVLSILLVLFSGVAASQTQPVEVAVNTGFSNPSKVEVAPSTAELQAKIDADILRLARDREHGAVLAYGTLASNIKTKAVLNFGANVLVDEVRHLTILNSVLGVPNY